MATPTSRNGTGIYLLISALGAILLDAENDRGATIGAMLVSGSVFGLINQGLKDPPMGA